MHVELILPELLAGNTEQPALPALEKLLGRGRRTDRAAADCETWLARAFGLSGALPAGALTALAGGLESGADSWLRADPVHLRADRDRLLLIPSQAFALTMEEAAALGETLRPLLAGRGTLYQPDAAHWCLRAESGAQAGAARPPIALALQNVDPNLPDKGWHALLTELQMAMYQHPVNTAREARGEPVVNSVWLWGGGALPASAQGPWQSVSAEDPAALGLARLAGIRHRSAGEGAQAWLERAPEDGRHLVLLDSLRALRQMGELEVLARRLQQLEQSWFAPLLAALGAGRVGMVSIHAPEAGASFETVRGDLRRFWRRARPLSAYASNAAGA
jgi:hypothetical protein